MRTSEPKDLSGLESRLTEHCQVATFWDLLECKNNFNQTTNLWQAVTFKLHRGVAEELIF